MKASVILLLLILLLPIGAARAEKPNDVAGGFKVNIPEGLYLYQPWINDVRFAPLFIIRDGKLLNPYELYGAKERGYRTDQTVEEEKALERFRADNITGKGFNIYVGTEKYGVLSEVDFWNLNYCEAKTMLSDIRGEGNYEGKEFTGDNHDKTTYLGKSLEVKYGALRAVATPSAYMGSKKNRSFIATEEDKAKVIKSVRQELVPAAMKAVNVRLRRPRRDYYVQDIAERGSELLFLRPTDFDDDGRKDFIGIYTLRVEYDERLMGSDKFWRQDRSAQIPFAMFDNGRAVEISLGASEGFLFNLVWAIDIDGDGIQELVIQLIVDDDEDGVPYEPKDFEYGFDYGREIIIFKHGQSGWKKIYSSGKICGEF